MFSNGFVVCVLAGKKILKETKGHQIRVPFGSEYTLRLKNKNIRDAVATIYIDGENVSEHGIVVFAGSHSDIERPTNSPTKFLFVSDESDSAIDAGKNGDPSKSNGIIEVRWRLKEAVLAASQTLIGFPIRNPFPFYRPVDYDYYPPYRPQPHVIWCGTPSPIISRSLNVSCNNSVTSNCGMSSNPLPMKSPEFYESGCTVKGSHSIQEFVSVDAGKLEETETIITLWLIGAEGAAEPQAPKQYCHNCGRCHVAPVKFCPGCGAKQ